MATLHRVGDHHPRDKGCEQPHDGCRVPRRLKHDLVVRSKVLAWNWPHPEQIGHGASQAPRQTELLAIILMLLTELDLLSHSVRCPMRHAELDPDPLNVEVAKLSGGHLRKTE